MTKVPYPQVLRRLLEGLKLPLTLEGFREAARLLRVRETDAIRQVSGPFKGCWDDKEIHRQISRHVFQRFPQLVPLVQDFEEEGAGYATLCAWLSGFLEDVAWLGGNRPWPTICLPVKRGVETGIECGILVSNRTGYHVYEHDTAFTPNFAKIIQSYPTVLEAALDGWKAD